MLNDSLVGLTNTCESWMSWMSWMSWCYSLVVDTHQPRLVMITSLLSCVPFQHYNCCVSAFASLSCFSKSLARSCIPCWDSWPSRSWAEAIGYCKENKNVMKRHSPNELPGFAVEHIVPHQQAKQAYGPIIVDVDCTCYLLGSPFGCDSYCRAK